jgi:hypothetical protein
VSHARVALFVVSMQERVPHMHQTAETYVDTSKGHVQACRGLHTDRNRKFDDAIQLSEDMCPMQHLYTPSEHTREAYRFQSGTRRAVV